MRICRDTSEAPIAGKEEAEWKRTGREPGPRGTKEMENPGWAGRFTRFLHSLGSCAHVWHAGPGLALRCLPTAGRTLLSQAWIQAALLPLWAPPSPPSGVLLGPEVSEKVPFRPWLLPSS